jgi:hypothetical protein
VTKQIETSKFVQGSEGSAGYAMAIPQSYPTTKSPGFAAPLVLGALAVFGYIRRKNHDR